VSLSKKFPAGPLNTRSIYNPTEFIQQSVDAVHRDHYRGDRPGSSLVVILFLQTWRAAIIPIVAIPVSLIGTFFFMAVFGFLAQQSVAVRPLCSPSASWVDDADRRGGETWNATSPAGPRSRVMLRSAPWMRSVRRLIAIGPWCCAQCFVPAAFITGPYRPILPANSALTITGATVISLIVSLTLSPRDVRATLEAATNSHQSDRWLGPPRSMVSFRALQFWLLTRSGVGYGWVVARCRALRRLG